MKKNPHIFRVVVTAPARLALAFLCSLIALLGGCSEFESYPEDSVTVDAPAVRTESTVAPAIPLHTVSVTGVSWAGEGEAPDLHGLVVVSGTSPHVVWSAVRGAEPATSPVNLEGDQLFVYGRVYSAGLNWWEDVEMVGEYDFATSDTTQVVVLCLGEACEIEVMMDVEPLAGCPAGHTVQDGACRFTQLVSGSGFDDASAWETGPWSYVHDVGLGDSDPGVGIIPSDAHCLGDWISQVVELPAGPLVAETRARATGIGTSALLVASGTTVGRVGLTASWSTLRTCLGDAATGPTTLELSGQYQGWLCTPTSPRAGIVFDYLRVLEPTEADRCPGVGAFSGLPGSPDGWLIAHGNSYPVAPTVTFGEDGATVETYGPCVHTRLWTKVSVPLPDKLVSPAVVVTIEGETMVQVGLQGATTHDSALWEPGDPPVVICADNVVGTVGDVYARFNAGAGSCGASETRTTTVTSISLESRPELCS